MTLRKGQKLVNYLSTREGITDGDMHRAIFHLDDSEFDKIINMSDNECWEVYNYANKS